MNIRTRSESILFRAAESLAQELARYVPDSDGGILLAIALAQAEEAAPPKFSLNRACLNVQIRGVPPEDL